MKIRIVAAVLVLVGCIGSLNCLRAEPSILETKDIQNFQVVPIHDANGAAVKVSGFAFHSALAVQNYELKREGKDMVLNLHLVLARKGLSGSFAYTLSLPEGIKRVLLGKDRVEIWPKREDQNKRP